MSSALENRLDYRAKIEQAGDLVVQAEQGHLVNRIHAVKTHLNGLSTSLKYDPVSNRVSGISLHADSWGKVSESLYFQVAPLQNHMSGDIVSNGLPRILVTM